MSSLRREFIRTGSGLSLVDAHQLHRPHDGSIKEWIRRLGWFGLWLVAQRSMRLWLADPTSSGSKAVLSPRNRCVAEELSARVPTIALDTTVTGRRSCSHGSS